MKIKTRGIVLHTTKYSETSLIVKIYTEEYGLGSFIVSGVRTKNGKIKSNFFQPLSLVEIEAIGKNGQALQRITEIHLSPPLSGITGDIIKSSIVMFLSEVIYRSIREEEPNKALFGFIDSAVQILDLTRNNCSGFHIFFLIQLSRHIGFYPHGVCIPQNSYFDLQEGRFTESLPRHPEILGKDQAWHLWELMSLTFENYYQLKINPQASRELLLALVRYYELHLTHGQPIRSHLVLEEVLN